MKLLKLLFSRGAGGTLMLIGTPVSLWIASLAWIVISMILLKMME